ncbi:hypothetical protein D9615_000717 [Tricholomella constricta]|uniref:Integrase catalytic domain-containing protein n=1 Tax=Tricholomella constricta TaxID=117010 RepID=A0A8H5MBA6_9AGAR|nr:hypothetical protein D9615_000717 [Tricholomella constricta]
MSNPNLFLLPTAEKFDGANWVEWKTTILNAARARGLMGYLQGTTTAPDPPDPDDTPTPTTAYWGSPNPTYEEWLQRDAYTQGMITLNVLNPIGQGVAMEGTAAETWESLTSLRDAKSDLALINAEESLSLLKYSEGADMEKHLAAMREAWAKANAQGAEITDTKFRVYILKSMPKSWSVLTGSLFAETTSAAVITRLTTHAMLTASTTEVSPAKSTQALSTQAGGKRPVRHPELKCDNIPNCGRTGHTSDQCFRPGGGLAGQYPEWWKGSKGGTTGTGKPTAAAATLPTANSAVISASNPATSPRCLAFSATTSDRVSPGSLVSYADSAASRHFFVDRADFETYKEVPSSDDTGTTASGGGFTILGTGRVRKTVEFNNETIELTFDDALHAPRLEHNLLSIGCLGKKGCTTTFDGKGATFYDPTGAPFMRGVCHNETMYRIDFVPKPAAMSARSLTRPADMETWHRRLGHVGESILREMIRGELVKGLDVTKTSVNGRCENCIMGKQARRPFDEDVIPECKPNQRVSFDLWGPARVKTTGGKSYMMLACDQGGAGVKGWFLADKTMETTGAVLESYHVESERQTGEKLLAVRTDEGTEFVNSTWSAYTTKFGIKHETTAPHSSAANGVVERMNRTILDRGRSMINDSGLPAHYWGEAMATAIHVSDFIPSSRHVGKTPHEIREGGKPDIAYLRPFGCIAYAKIPKEDGGSKLDMRSIKCVLIGYFGRGDYKLLDRSTGRIFRSRDVIFEEGRANRTLAPIDEDADDGQSLLNDFLPAEAATTPAPTEQAPPHAPAITEPTELRRSTRTKTISNAALEAIDTEKAADAAADKGLDWARENKRSTGTALSAITDSWLPKSYSEAMTRPHLWKGPMDEEMARMHEWKVWTLVERPEGARTMKNRWTFALKYDENGVITGRKARLVAKGFSQIPGVDFFASYASVVKYESLRINLALGTAKDWSIWQIDYSSAYLNAPNQVPILMEQPEGYELTPSQVLRMELMGGTRNGGGDTGDSGTDGENRKEIVALVDKALYGTMDGAYNWWRTLDQDMARIGYRRSRADPSVRSRTRDTGDVTITSTYTDDTSGMSSSPEEAALAIAELGEKYGIKNLGDIKLVLGIRIIRDRDQRLLTMDQEEYLKRTPQLFPYNG